VVDDNEDVHSDCSDDTTYSTWRAPPQDLRGNKYQNEMKVQDELMQRNLFCAMAVQIVRQPTLELLAHMQLFIET
jgi:CDP-diacylglycerol pyrophosphatase